MDKQACTLQLGHDIFEETDTVTGYYTCTVFQYIICSDFTSKL